MVTGNINENKLQAMNDSYNIQELEMAIALLRDERARNGWTKEEANRHSELMEQLKPLTSNSKYL